MLQKEPISQLQPESTSWQFFTRTDDAWRAMYDDCEQATSSIEFEQYIVVAGGGVGNDFIELFIRKLHEGVTVTILCDAIGSPTVETCNAIHDFRKAGGKIHFYHPIGLKHTRRFFYWFYRDHRKILVVDGKVAYTGGVCFDQKMTGWRDTHIRITGPVVIEVQNAFRRLWNRTSRRKHHLRIIREEAVASEFSYYSSNPRFHRNRIYQALLDEIGQAKDYVYLTTPYFIPSRHFMAVLCEAAKRGVKVVLIVPGITEYWFVSRVAESFFGKAIKAGVTILQYQQSHLHSKVTVIDDRWATMGSLNLDRLSFYRNVEANLIIKDKAAIAELKHHFLNDRKSCQAVTMESWNKRPLFHKVIGFCGRAVKRIM